MKSNTITKNREKPSVVCPNNENRSTKYANILEQEASDLYSSPMDMLLKFEVNEKGVGRILLPPSLSALLHSDRISISPFAGGLFIRSV